MKSVRIRLPTTIGSGTHLVQPAGRDPDAYRAHLLAFGPITSPVLESLRTVALSELNLEIEALIRRSGQIDGEMASVELPADPFEHGLLAWRWLSVWARTAEDLAAIVRAVERWQMAGRPNHVECQIGHDYLRWIPAGGDEVRKILQNVGDPSRIQRLLMLPTVPETMEFVSPEDAERIDAVCKRTSEDTAAWFGSVAALVTEDAHRTFVRRKHRLTATTPSKVPLWLAVEGDVTQAEAQQAFGQGFAVIDWEPGKAGASGPELIAWVTTADDTTAYISAAMHGIEMLGTVIDAVLRLVDPKLPIVPWRSHLALSDDESAALLALDGSDYRDHLRLGLR